MRKTGLNARAKKVGGPAACSCLRPSNLPPRCTINSSHLAWAKELQALLFASIFLLEKALVVLLPSVLAPVSSPEQSAQDVFSISLWSSVQSRSFGHSRRTELGSDYPLALCTLPQLSSLSFDGSCESRSTSSLPLFRHVESNKCRAVQDVFGSFSSLTQ